MTDISIVAAHAGIFRSSHDLKDVAPKSVMKRIREQPGYRKGQAMKLSLSTNGGYRLYTLVAGRWMDASLNDM